MKEVVILCLNIFNQIAYMKKTTIAFKPTFRHHFIQGTVTEIDLQGKKVTIGNGDGMEILLFTDLVIATGSRGPMPAKIFERRAEDASRKYRELGNEVTCIFRNTFAKHFL